VAPRSFAGSWQRGCCKTALALARLCSRVGSGPMSAVGCDGHSLAGDRVHSALSGAYALSRTSTRRRSKTPPASKTHLSFEFARRHTPIARNTPDHRTSRLAYSDSHPLAHRLLCPLITNSARDALRQTKIDIVHANIAIGCTHSSPRPPRTLCLSLALYPDIHRMPLARTGFNRRKAVPETLLQNTKLERRLWKAAPKCTGKQQMPGRVERFASAGGSYGRVGD